jgi:lipopolysaccharide/colanic/teichoic acid biosynthesis glycosyltransferase
MTASVRPLLSEPRTSSVNEVGVPDDGDAGEIDGTIDGGSDGATDHWDGALVTPVTVAEGGELDPHAATNPAIRIVPNAGPRRLPLIDRATAGILSGRIRATASVAFDRSRRTDGALPDWIQRAVAGLALVALSPVLLAIAIAVRIDSSGPVLFGARRVGQDAVRFTAWKFRTMRWQPSEGASRISGPGDPRVTGVGSALRRTRLDELPQLWNVVRGEMRLVGPRPEDPAFVDAADPRWAVVLALRPGITGLAQLAFHDEASVLDRADPETSYRKIVLPRKLAVDAAYAQARSALLDVRILIATMRIVAGGPPPDALIDRVAGNLDWRLPQPATKR